MLRLIVLLLLIRVFHAFQTHISLTGIRGEMSISFVTYESYNGNHYSVSYSTNPSNLLFSQPANIRKYINIAAESYIRTVHEAILPSLPLNSTIYYQIRCVNDSGIYSQLFHFFMDDCQVKEDFSFLIYADGVGIHFDKLLQFINETNEMNDNSFTLYPGDMAFTPLETKWDIYGNLHEQVFGYHPIIVAEGNHEDSYEYESFIKRFTSQIGLQSGSTRPSLWHSFNYRTIHVITLASCEYFNLHDEQQEQYEWLENDLKNVNKSKTPLIIVQFHHPLYTTGNHSPRMNLRILEHLFDKYDVSIVFNGHNHNYERICEVKGGICMPGNTNSDYYVTNGTVYAIVGSGGRPLYPFEKPIASYDVVRIDNAYGFLKCIVNVEEIKMTCSFVKTGPEDVEQGDILDTFTIHKRWMCNGLNNDDPNACEGMNVCVGPNNCTTIPDYSGGVTSLVSFTLFWIIALILLMLF